MPIVLLQQLINVHCGETGPTDSQQLLKKSELTEVDSEGYNHLTSHNATALCEDLANYLLIL